MNENDAEKIWNLILTNFALANAEEVQPDDEELRILAAYEAGDPELQPCLSQDELLKELNLAE